MAIMTLVFEIDATGNEIDESMMIAPCMQETGHCSSLSWKALTDLSEEVLEKSIGIRCPLKL